MASVTKTRKTVQRTMHYMPAAGLLFIDEGKKSTGYTIVENTADVLPPDHVGARAFQLTKPDGTVYDVRIQGVLSSCDCISFEHRGMNIQGGKGCKHIAALTKLQQLGKL